MRDTKPERDVLCFGEAVPRMVLRLRKTEPIEKSRRNSEAIACRTILAT